MRVGILAGKKESRLAEETVIKPKPMVEIGGKPIIWHIMMLYGHYGFTDFAIALGYIGEVLKKYFRDYASLNGHLSVNLRSGEVTLLHCYRPDWTVDLIDTGMATMIGCRIKRLASCLDEGTFMLTWGDGVSDINLQELLAFHRSHGKLATLTAVLPLARYGHLVFQGDRVAEFTEKPQIGEGWINGAFFVLEPNKFDYSKGNDTQWEREPLERLAADGQLIAYKHTSYWQCMDTLRQNHILETLWQSGNAPWAVWEKE